MTCSRSHSNQGTGLNVASSTGHNVHLCYAPRVKTLFCLLAILSTESLKMEKKCFFFNLEKIFIFLFRKFHTIFTLMLQPYIVDSQKIFTAWKRLVPFYSVTYLCSHPTSLKLKLTRGHQRRNSREVGPRDCTSSAPNVLPGAYRSDGAGRGKHHAELQGLLMPWPLSCGQSEAIRQGIANSISIKKDYFGVIPM